MKLLAAIKNPNIATISIVKLFQCPSEESFVEKPPVEAVVSECATASKALIPKAKNARAINTVREAYIYQNFFAVSATLGAILSTPAPGASASMRPNPLARSDGKTETTRTTIPMPPIHWVSCRYKSIPDPWISIELCTPKTVEPVAVNPDTDSKSESTSTSGTPIPFRLKVPASR